MATSGLNYLALAAALALHACPPNPQPPDSGADAAPKPSPSDGGFPVFADADPGDDPAEAAAKYPACVRACAALKTYGCPEAARLPGGKTCYQVCADGETTGLSLKPSCVAAAKNAADVRMCATVRCQK